MASRQHNKGDASASPNVVRLPTAAPRRVRNNRWAEQRKAAIAARQGNPFAERFVHPFVRERATAARAFVNVERSPALNIAMAIFGALAPEVQERVRDRMAHAPEARALLTFAAPMTYGDQTALQAAIGYVELGKL